MPRHTRSQRFRISDRISEAQSAFPGTLHAQFSAYFSYLLDSEHSAEVHSDFAYVSHPKIEERLKQFIDAPRNQITALTGARGAGKSTILRHVFGFTTQPSFYSPTTLVIPFFMDTYRTDLVDVDDLIFAQISAAADLALSQKNLRMTDSDLFDFITKHKTSLLHGMSVKRNSNKEQRIDHLRKEKPYAYAAECLKFAASDSDINRIILIVDDIESSEYVLQKRLIKGILHFRDCLKNTGIIRRTYRAEFIFACRPATFSLLKREPEIDGFSIRSPIHLAEPVALADIIQTRFDIAIKAIGEGRIPGGFDQPLSRTQDQQQWREAYDALMTVTGAITSRYGDAITRLCNNDLRRAMNETMDVLINSRWYEVSNHQSGAFDVLGENYRTTLAGVFRAMTLKGARVYRGIADDCCVPNVFFNFESNEADLMVVYILKTFFEMGRIRPVNYFTLSSLKDKLEICYNRDIVEMYFDGAVDYMADHEMIRQEEIERNGSRVRYLIPMTKSFFAWRSLSDNSIFLEFFRDSTYMKHESSQLYNNGRLCATARLRGSELFKACADFVEEVAEAERRVRTHVSRGGHFDSYRRSFGTRPIARHLLRGLKKSISTYYEAPLRGGPKGETIPGDLSTRVRQVEAYMKGAGIWNYR